MKKHRDQIPELSLQKSINFRTGSMSDKIKTYTLSAEKKEVCLQRISGFLKEDPSILFAYAHGSFLGSSNFRDLDIAVFFDARQPAPSPPFSLTTPKRLFPVMLNPDRIRAKLQNISGALERLGTMAGFRK